MSIAVATYGRRMQFSAGPQSFYFYVCERHKAELEGKTFHLDLFYADPRWPIEPVDPDDENDCDACRGEDGPDV